MKNISTKNNKIVYISFLLITSLFIGCGGGSDEPSRNTGTGSIDLADYFPNKNMSKTFSTVEGNLTDLINSGSYSDEIEVQTTDANISTITTTKNNGDKETLVFTDKNITIQSKELNSSAYRHVNLGDTFFTFTKEYSQDIKERTIDYAKITRKVNLTCTINKQLKEYVDKGKTHKYTGDILEVKCIDNGKMIIAINPDLIKLNPDAYKDINGSYDIYDISYTYFQKNIGDIANIDDNCVLKKGKQTYIDDRKSDSECIEKHHDYEYYNQ